MSEQESAHYERRPDGTAACRLCPHRCDVAPGGFGRCKVRANLGGVLYATNYQELASLALAPIERVPLFHFKPGAHFLVVGSLGDSFPAELAAWRSPADPDASRWASAQEVVDIASHNSVAGLAYAGGEPFMWLEEWRELAAAARADGRLNVAVTNGFALPAARADVAGLLDAVNLVLLGPAEVYRRRLQADREPVIETAVEFHARGIHVELTWLVLPGESDGPAALDDCGALAARLGGAPIHVTSPVNFETAAPVRLVQQVAEALRTRAPRIHVSAMYGGSDPPAAR